MRVHTLSLTNVRNFAFDTALYTPRVFTFNEGLNIIIGKNGVGKSTLLEALYVLSVGKSFRTSDLSELISHSNRLLGARIEGVISSVAGEFSLAATVTPKDTEHYSKEFYFQNQKVRGISNFIGKLSSVLFVPSDLTLITGSPQIRRTFLDRSLCLLYPQSISLLLEYQKALKHKNALLRNEMVSINELSPWNEILAEKAALIEQARVLFIEKLMTESKIIFSSLSPEIEKISAHLQSTIGAKSKEEIFSLLESHRGKEIAAGVSLYGPHRDDLVVEFNGYNAHAVCSQGQIRSITLSMILAVLYIFEKERGESPAVLLDDVNSELDAERSSAFFKHLFSSKRQVLLTGTDASLERLSTEYSGALITL